MSDTTGNKTTFDAERIISVKAITADGIKKIDVRFPSDEEWIEHSRRHRLVYRNLGRGIQEQVNQDPVQGDAELLATIRQGEGPEIDPYEAFRILEELSRTRVVENGAEPDPLRINLAVPGATTVHVFRMPTAKEKFQLGKLASSRSADNREVWSLNYSAAGDLYDAICKESVHYVGRVPIIHKLAALQAVNTALTRALEGDEPENF